jgi:hypothetical protein
MNADFERCWTRPLYHSCRLPWKDPAQTTLCPVAYATKFDKGLEVFAGVSKTCLDLAGEQNTEVLASSRLSRYLISIAGRWQELSCWPLPSALVEAGA